MHEISLLYNRNIYSHSENGKIYKESRNILIFFQYHKCNDPQQIKECLYAQIKKVDLNIYAHI